VRTIAKNITSTPTPYTVKVLAYQNGNGRNAAPQLIIGSSIAGVRFVVAVAVAEIVVVVVYRLCSSRTGRLKMRERKTWHQVALPCFPPRHPVPRFHSCVFSAPIVEHVVVTAIVVFSISGCCCYHSVYVDSSSSTVVVVEVWTCKSAICVRIESRIESGVKIRIRIESLNRIVSTPTNINY